MKKLYLIVCRMRCILHPGNLLSILLFTFTLTVNAQDSTITGTVSSVDGENLPGVNVLVKGSSQGTITSVDGTYRIQASFLENSYDKLLICI